MSLHNKKNSKGIGLIEVVVAVAIIVISLTALAALANFALSIQSHLKQELIATNLAVEAMEATAAAKSDNWSIISGLTLGAPYYPVKSGSPLKWTLSAGAENINGFSRQVTFAQVNRDSNDDIVLSGGTQDPESRKATVLVSWNEKGKNYQVSLDSYLMNW
ncbi:MAG: hypothetical protein A2174_01280 [Candidatus Portnoybacteria bacterium RBG_13_41_18]|uniref:Uncharacterized protein n=1 Tax=Candidatus Portnoybacteria bacterium RBG_13_41_18 TaxID=1801991 RepID=A0A1G2F629_9BACT|nr:MAG: hypothetical protein A2174_01280 [Candidatus Portnoybacteria bacterium RBG_13_41_18]